MSSYLSRVKKGQAAMEIAIFGAILAFILGAIVRTGLSSGYQQNQSLKAMRIAMSKSFLYSEGVVGSGTGDGEASRNVASVLVIEDRLTVEASKFSPTDRIPFVFSNSATHSRNLMMPINNPSKEFYHLPILDLFVNGKHFPLRLAGFKTICLEKDNPGLCSGQNENFDYVAHPGYWDPTCGGLANTVFLPTGGCARLFVIIVNNPRESKWCNDISDTSVNGYLPCTGNLNGIQRFDLNLDWTKPAPSPGAIIVPAGLVLVDPGDPGPPIVRPPQLDYPRRDFSWQWFAIHATDEEIAKPSDPGSEGMILNIKESKSKNVQVDIDGDLEEEQIVKIDKHRGPVITQVTVTDSQEGDLDFSRAGLPGAKTVGLLADTAIMAQPTPGSYLRIEEGKMYGPTGQFVRNVRKKDQIDLIERKLQLSKNTGRFCGNTPGPALDKIDENANGFVDPLIEKEDNPVKVCVATDGECYGSNEQDTCYSLESDIIYIRSKPIDTRGRKWITDVSKDDYINVATPTVSETN